MKAAVAITLIICGVVVVAIPALWHAWDSFMAATTMAHINQPNFSVNFGEIPGLYQFACWILGATMIGVSIVSSILQSSVRPSARLAVGAG